VKLVKLVEIFGTKDENILKPKLLQQKQTVRSNL